MICKVCGAEMDNNLENCRVCGAVLEKEAEFEEVIEVNEAPAEYKDVFGLISFILGIVGLVSCTAGFSIAAIVFGSIAKKKAVNAGTTSKRGSTGVTLGIIGTVIGLIFAAIVGAVYGGMLGSMMGGMYY